MVLPLTALIINDRALLRILKVLFRIHQSFFLLLEANMELFGIFVHYVNCDVLIGWGRWVIGGREPSIRTPKAMSTVTSSQGNEAMSVDRGSWDSLVVRALDS